ncbi:MAG: isoprenylcysteine carboxylmethyltransferase family protein [archaeon]
MMLFYAAFAVCLACYCVHAYYHRQEHTGNPSARYDKNVKYVVFGGWIAWFAMVFFDSTKGGSALMQDAGTLLGTVGILLVVLSYTHIPFRDPKKLITSGIYKLVRHPTYYGSILMVAGVPMVFGSMMALYTSPIWIGFMLYWTLQEEKYLAVRYKKDWAAYRKKTII